MLESREGQLRAVCVFRLSKQGTVPENEMEDAFERGLHATSQRELVASDASQRVKRNVG